MIEQNNNQPEQNAIRERISKHLREIEEQHHIKILHGASHLLTAIGMYASSMSMNQSGTSISKSKRIPSSRCSLMKQTCPAGT